MKKRMRHFSHVLEQKDFFFFFKFQKGIPNERNALNRTDESPFQQLATKIKAFQLAFEVRDSAVNGTCRQDNLLTKIDAISSTCLLHLVVARKTRLSLCACSI